MIQPAIDKGRSRFSEAQQIDQLDSIDLNGTGLFHNLRRWNSNRSHLITRHSILLFIYLWAETGAHTCMRMGL